MTTPTFKTPVINPFSLANVLVSSAPTFADLDGDGDLDALVGNVNGETRYFENTGSATAPAFAAPVTNPFGLTDVGTYAAPTLADLDSDGDLDAFVGNYPGNILYYQNTGSALVPAFAVPVTNPFGLADVGSISAPTFADLDGDGDLDAFAGRSNGDTLYYQNTGSATAPAFAAPLTNPFGLTDVGNLSVPTLADLDGDGDLDAFVGNSSGDTWYYQNTGSATAPAFDAPSTNPFGLTNVGSFAKPALVDLDGDGDLDALVGNWDGNTLYYQNTGSATAPAFAAPLTNPFGLTDVGNSAVPIFADLDGDGDLDAFVGERYGDTLYYQNTGSATAPAFAAPLTNPFGLSGVGSFAKPAFADLDGDGDLDAFVGERFGNMLYYQNTVCFLHGTRILTRAGYVPVQDLRPGDEVQTLSHGFRPVVWLGVRHVQPDRQGRFDHAALPIRIRPDAFGAGMPNRDLWVSPDHAVFFRHHLIPAKALVNGATVIRDAEVESIAYYHVLLDRHAVVFSEGLPTESYSPAGEPRLLREPRRLPRAMAARRGGPDWLVRGLSSPHRRGRGGEDGAGVSGTASRVSGGLGGIEAGRIGPRVLRRHPAALAGSHDRLRGPLPRLLKPLTHDQFPK